MNNVRRDSPARKENHMPGMQAGFSCRTMRVHSRFLQQGCREAEIFELEAGYCCSDEGRTVRAEQNAERVYLLPGHSSLCRNPFPAFDDPFKEQTVTFRCRFRFFPLGSQNAGDDQSGILLHGGDDLWKSLLQYG